MSEQRLSLLRWRIDQAVIALDFKRHDLAAAILKGMYDTDAAPKPPQETEMDDIENEAQEIIDVALEHQLALPPTEPAKRVEFLENIAQLAQQWADGIKEENGLEV